MPVEGWPLGMFPSPIAHAGFDPYTNPQDKLDYHRLGGSQDYILQFETMRAQRRLRSEPGSYPDHAQMAAQAVDMVEAHRKRQRISEAFRHSKP